MINPMEREMADTRSFRAKTPTTCPKTIRNRFCASCEGRSATRGCFPITSSSSGTRSTMS